MPSFVNFSAGAGSAGDSAGTGASLQKIMVRAKAIAMVRVMPARAAMRLPMPPPGSIMAGSSKMPMPPMENLRKFRAP